MKMMKLVVQGSNAYKRNNSKNHALFKIEVIRL